MTEVPTTLVVIHKALGPIAGIEEMLANTMMLCVREIVPLLSEGPAFSVSVAFGSFLEWVKSELDVHSFRGTLLVLYDK